METPNLPNLIDTYRIDVTCAIIEIEDKVLVVQRSEKMNLPLKWEFPGGKVKKDESNIQCVVREIKEELDIDIEISKKLNNSIFNYNNNSIRLIPFIAKKIGGELKLNEHKNFIFLEKKDLLNLDWAEADIPVVKEYLSL